jgi:membrane-associated protease RseP (regulator of RpoE activity)
VSAGSIMHFLQAFLLFFIVFCMLGVPGGGALAERLGGPPVNEEDWTVGSIQDGSAAAAAGLQLGDEVVSIDGEPLTTFDDVGPLVAPNPGDEVELVVLRDGAEIELTATLGHRAEDPSKGFLGIGPTYPELPPVRVNPIRGVVESGRLTVEAMGQTVTGLVTFFSGGVDDFASDVANGGKAAPPTSSSSTSSGSSTVDESDSTRLMSIYGVARIGEKATSEGMIDFLLLLAGVNISIGILNMIPLLPLDGGHAAIATYERIRSIGGRRYMVDVSRLLPITYAVFMFMMLLGMSAIYLDIVDPIG